MAHGERALEVATTVKLSRALWIVPLTLAFAWQTTRRERRSERPAGASRPRAARPWFIAGFVALALLVTLVPALRPVGEVLAGGARRLMVVALFLIGASLSRAALRRVGIRPFLQGVALWVAIAGLSLAVIRGVC